ncbi:hypothetical protein [Flexibacterium corallicola]|uniref:hypothetical protein n=1 Tax=Flexibacterium corallicola TaxID=3037259 RepID=UPI00286F0225|nr:hypothetical protein [Pseudovibrio sp. M1P-2-3]
MRKLHSRRALFTLGVALGLSGNVCAQVTESPLEQRVTISPAVAYLKSQGVNLTAIGKDGGLEAYLGQNANGDMQTFYITSDGSYILTGVLHDTKGRNITGIQLAEMRARFNAASLEFGQDTPQNNKTASPEPAPDIKIKDRISQAYLNIPIASGEVVQPENVDASLFLSSIPRDTFLERANETAYFQVGHVSAPNELWMVADPQCPFCHQAWSKLKTLVLDRKLRIKIILIAGLQGSKPRALDMLSKDNISSYWFETEGGRLQHLTDSPNMSADARSYLTKNESFARDFELLQTPFLAYVDGSGRFYSSKGLPNDINVFLSAMK